VKDFQLKIPEETAKDRELRIRCRIAELAEIIQCRSRFFFKLKEEYERTSSEINELYKEKFALEKIIVPVKVCSVHKPRTNTTIVHGGKTLKNISYMKLSIEQENRFVDFVEGLWKEKGK
jgi:hypothetical protein